MAQGGIGLVGGTLAPGNTLTQAVVMTESSATRTHPVVGQVVDNDEPIAGVEVIGDNQGSGPDGTATTGADGRYRLMLRAGTYRVSFALSGFAPATYPGTGLSEVDVVVDLDGTVRVGAGPVEEPEQVSLIDATGDATISGVLASRQRRRRWHHRRGPPRGCRPHRGDPRGHGHHCRHRRLVGRRPGDRHVRRPVQWTTPPTPTYIQTYVGGRIARDREAGQGRPGRPGPARHHAHRPERRPGHHYDREGGRHPDVRRRRGAARRGRGPDQRSHGHRRTAGVGHPGDGRHRHRRPLRAGSKPGTYRLDYAASGSPAPPTRPPARPRSRSSSRPVVPSRRARSTR